MGYSTQLDGILKFVNEPSIAQIKRLNEMLGEDSDDHGEWRQYGIKDTSYIQWELTKDFSGIQWDGGEKFYGIVESVNLILAFMREEFPDFGFTGEVLAQGDDISDRWKLVIEDGKAVRRDIVVGEAVVCPHCRRKFFLSEAKK